MQRQPLTTRRCACLRSRACRYSTSYRDNLKELGSFTTLEDFWRCVADLCLAVVLYSVVCRRVPQQLTRGARHPVLPVHRYYVHLKRPSELQKDMNMYIFRTGYTPMWEVRRATVEGFPRGRGRCSVPRHLTARCCAGSLSMRVRTTRTAGAGS